MSLSFKDNITINLVQPNYVEEISGFIDGRKMWRKIGLFCETASKVLMGAGSVLSFASGVYQNTNFSFAAGTVSTLSVVFLQFSNFCHRETKKSTEKLNKLLENLKLDTIPEVDLLTKDKDDELDTNQKN